VALVVHGPDHVNARVWHVMQHEGFHQFAAAVIGGQRPVWVNEGLAEYFGEAVYTGDGFIAGIIPQWRLARLRKEFETNQFKSIEQMMEMSLDEWNSKLSIVNYDQGWSMVHFLVHGDGGKYRAAFSSFMIDLSHNRPWQRAWQDNFGEATGFEQRWRDWWKRLPDDPTADLYARATVVTLTSFIARAASQKQTFASFDDFSRSARSGKLSIAPDQWLPDSLLRDALEQCDKLSEGGAALSLASTRLTCRLKSGITLTGRFTLRNGSIIIDVDQR
jgi:hypothetical protein